MNNILDVLNQKWYWILIAFAVTIFIHIGLRYYYWNWSAENFDNIVTPIATVLSSLLFAWIAFRQYRQSVIQNEIVREQNRIALSQNLKVNFQEEITTFEKAFYERNIHDRLFVLVGHRIAPVIPQVITSSSAIDFLASVINRITSSSDYQSDLDDLVSSNLGNRGISYYRSRDYFNDVSIILVFGRYADLLKTPLAVVFLDNVGTSPMLKPDQRLFGNRIDRLYSDFQILVEYKHDIYLPDLFRIATNPLPWSMLGDLGFNSQVLLIKNKLP